MSVREGGCACGAIRFRVNGQMMGVGVCHCRDCQKASGGPPNYVALAPNEAFELLRGRPRFHISRGDSGAEVKRAFCPDCGSPLWSVPADAPFMPIKLGALDDSSDLSPALHLYVASAAPWHLLHDGVPRFDKMPPAPAP